MTITFSETIGNKIIPNALYWANIFNTEKLFKYNESSKHSSSKSSITYLCDHNASNTKIKIKKKIDSLISKKLKKDLDITIEHDDEGFIAMTLDLPLYGYGDYPEIAINNLKSEIESCYFDLMEDDNFTEEWLKYKRYLIDIIG